MTERDIWVRACTIVAEHGMATMDYIIDRIEDALGDRGAVEDWCRVGAAVDEITASSPYGSN